MIIRTGLNIVVICMANLSIGGDVELLHEGASLRLAKFSGRQKEETVHLERGVSRSEILKRVNEVADARIKIEFEDCTSGPVLRVTYIGIRPDYSIAVLAGGDSCVETILAREVRPEEAGYEVVFSITHYPEGTTIEQIRTECAKAKDSTSVLKIEVMRDPTRDARYFGKVTYLGRSIKEKTEGDRWCEWAKGALSCSKGTKSFRAKGCQSFFDVSARLFAGERIRFGFVEDSYVGPKGEHVAVDVYEVQDRDLDEHAFLKRLIREDFAVQKTPVGFVVRREDKWGKTTDQGRGKGYAWPSGKRRAVFITSLGTWPDELVAQYLQKFPSNLTEKATFDKNIWGKQEVEDIVGRLGSQLSVGTVWNPRGNLSSLALQLEEVLSAEGISNRLQESKSWEEAKENYDSLMKWWNLNKEKVRWDEKTQCLLPK
jgi:hypothetical protein